MENSNINKPRTSNSIWGGLVLLLIGMVFLLDNLNINVPHWITSWHMILLVIGLIVGVKHNFRGAGWIIMVAVGGIFTLNDFAELNLNMGNLWPLILIGIGLSLILRPKKGCKKHKFRKHLAQQPDFTDPIQASTDPMGSTGTTGSAATGHPEDFLDSVNVFGGSHQKVFTKNFKGGDILAIFGGCDVDLTQADFQNEITIEVTAIFGGCKIIIPPTWEVKSEVTAIFGGVDDKRNLMPSVDGGTKRVVLRGLALFGGVEIKNY
ncbi:MAG: hypothetical protein EOP47_27235 [Sphingobacteriaceae bacterium]|nr:MAG: hypothetical protein EOP47_27235 [Sphingobacteriaceae bacterium]